MAARRESGFRSYLIRRTLLMLPTLFGVTLIVFVLCQFVPGGPVDQVLMQAKMGGASGEAGGGYSRQSSMGPISEKALQDLKAFYGFDLPLHERYLRYLGQLVRFDLGVSFRYQTPVVEMIKDRLPISVYYGLVTTILTYSLCLPLGILKAIKHRTVIDNATSVAIFTGYAIPGFALGAILLTIFAVKYGWFPLGGFRGPNFDQLSLWGKIKNQVWHSVLPLICYMIGAFAFMTMLVKNSLLENMSADYVKTALANGLTWRRAVFVHAMRNSLIPLATTFGHNISLLLTGSLLIERVFNIPGLGLFFFEAIQQRDYPVVMAVTVVGTLLLVVGNLLSDICVATVDPRVRFR